MSLISCNDITKIYKTGEIENNFYLGVLFQYGNIQNISNKSRQKQPEAGKRISLVLRKGWKVPEF